jgi:hypothetical protein
MSRERLPQSEGIMSERDPNYMKGNAYHDLDPERGMGQNCIALPSIPFSPLFLSLSPCFMDMAPTFPDSIIPQKLCSSAF